MNNINPDGSINIEDDDDLVDDYPDDEIKPMPLQRRGLKSIINPIAGPLFGIDPSHYQQWRNMMGGNSKDDDSDNRSKYDGTDFDVDWCGVKNECKHEPIDVGFNRSKMVCRKCDKELDLTNE